MADEGGELCPLTCTLYSLEGIQGLGLAPCTPKLVTEGLKSEGGRAWTGQRRTWELLAAGWPP